MTSRWWMCRSTLGLEFRRCSTIGERMSGEQWSPGAKVALEPEGGMEILVLTGSFQVLQETFSPLSWLRLPIGDRLTAIAGPAGCRVWIKEGHLRFAPLQQR